MAIDEAEIDRNTVQVAGVPPPKPAKNSATPTRPTSRTSLSSPVPTATQPFAVTFKPMAGVGVARDVLDLVDRANKRFLGGLSDEQRTVLAGHPFDFGDYLLFSTRWEDAISGL